MIRGNIHIVLLSKAPYKVFAAFPPTHAHADSRELPLRVDMLCLLSHNRHICGCPLKKKQQNWHFSKCPKSDIVFAFNTFILSRDKVLLGRGKFNFFLQVKGSVEWHSYSDHKVCRMRRSGWMDGSLKRTQEPAVCFPCPSLTKSL